MLREILEAILITIIGTTIVVLSAKVLEQITFSTIRNVVSTKCPSALKAVILEKRKNAIDVGIFTDYSQKHTHELTIESEEGVDRNLRKGMQITI